MTRPFSPPPPHPPVDSRFRGNDGGGGMQDGLYGCSRPGFVRWPGFVVRGRGARPCAPTLYGRQRHMKPPNPIRPPGTSPLPAGEGWVREKRHRPPTPYDTAQPHRHSAPTVTPAKAGIHPRLSIRRGLPEFWIPACAGMTVGRTAVRVCWVKYGYKIPPTPLCERGLFSWRTAGHPTAATPAPRWGARPGGVRRGRRRRWVGR